MIKLIVSTPSLVQPENSKNFREDEDGQCNHLDFYHNHWLRHSYSPCSLLFHEEEKGMAEENKIERIP